MDDLALLIDLHRHGERQGPGSPSDTRLAVKLSGLVGTNGLSIADLGCGTGASTLVLAQELDTTVVAVDIVEDFLRTLENKADRMGLGDRITTRTASMAALPFDDAAFDAIWSEGAIYNNGFENGIGTLRRFLKPGGILAVSELTWLTRERPAELESYWSKTLSRGRYRRSQDGATGGGRGMRRSDTSHSPSKAGSSTITGRCRSDLTRSCRATITAQQRKPTVAAEKTEIDLYERHAAFIGYGYYIAKRL